MIEAKCVKSLCPTKREAASLIAPTSRRGEGREEREEEERELDLDDDDEKPDDEKPDGLDHLSLGLLSKCACLLVSGSCSAPAMTLNE